jgi:hypothetical protein
MKRKSTLILTLIFGMSLIISCVAPYYGTARIEPGADINAGIAYTTGITAWPSSVQGIRADIYAGQGLNRYLKPYVRASVGVGYETYYPETFRDEDGFLPIFDAGVGLHCALDLKYITPAIVIELSPYMGVSVSTALLMGIGNREIVTLGVRPHFTVGGFTEQDPIDVFASIHPFGKWSFFAGTEITTLSDYGPWFTVGLGYRLY